MEKESIVVLIIIGTIVVLTIIRLLRRKNGKEWNIFEHQEGDANNPRRCYLGQHKRTGYKTKCYSTKEELLSAVQKERGYTG